MKFFKGLIYTFILSLFVTTCFSLATKRPVIVSYPELQTIGLENIEEIKSNLGLANDSDQLVIRHVITTGKNKANHDYLFLDIRTLEQIKPSAKSSSIIRSGNQIPLNDVQIRSAINALKLKPTNVPRWLMDKSQKKYINVVLQKKNSTDSNISVLSTHDAKVLVDWAIKNKHLLTKDHP